MFRRHPSASTIDASTCRRALVPPSTVVRRVRADEDLPGARRRSDPTDDPWALYRRAASTMIRLRPRRSK